MVGIELESDSVDLCDDRVREETGPWKIDTELLDEAPLDIDREVEGLQFFRVEFDVVHAHVALPQRHPQVLWPEAVDVLVRIVLDQVPDDVLEHCQKSRSLQDLCCCKIKFGVWKSMKLEGV